MEKNKVDAVISAQHEQMERMGNLLGEAKTEANKLKNQLDNQFGILLGIDSKIGSLECDIDTTKAKVGPGNTIKISEEEYLELQNKFNDLFTNENLAISHAYDWQGLCKSAEAWFNGRNTQPRALVELLTNKDRDVLKAQLTDEFVFKKANCDKIDYSLAALCGVFGGLIDVLFVGAPGEGVLTQFSDNMVNKVVQTVARRCGWDGGREGCDPVKSAIGYLEGMFTVNYDQRHSGDVNGQFRMSPKNHHIKNLAHSPDPIGLIFSIIDQFSNTSHFVSDGKLISIETEPSKLSRLVGHTFVAKIFAGFVNWLGHLISDIAGSSGASGRGTGIPMPFFELFQFIDIGKFGQFHQSFATICVKVFETGYDARHGIALSIPVLITELITRLVWSIKQIFYHNKDWTVCIAKNPNQELQRMLFTSYGAFCLVDAADAGARSCGNLVLFLTRTNIIAWSRFGILSLREAHCILQAGKIDHSKVDKYLDEEFARILSNS